METKNLAKAVKALGLFVADNAAVNDSDTAQVKAVCIYVAAFLQGAAAGFPASDFSGLPVTTEEARQALAENIGRGSITVKK